MSDSYGAHPSHCCRWHGCKYSNDACPVTTGKVAQEYPCMDCGEEVERYREQAATLRELYPESAAAKAAADGLDALAAELETVRGQLISLPTADQCNEGHEP